MLPNFCALSWVAPRLILLVKLDSYVNYVSLHVPPTNSWLHEKPRGAQLNEALLIQMEAQRRLSDQLEVCSDKTLDHVFVAWDEQDSKTTQKLSVCRSRKVWRWKSKHREGSSTRLWRNTRTGRLGPSRSSHTLRYYHCLRSVKNRISRTGRNSSRIQKMSARYHQKKNSELERGSRFRIKLWCHRCTKSHHSILIHKTLICSLLMGSARIFMQSRKSASRGASTRSRRRRPCCRACTTIWITKNKTVFGAVK